MPDCDKMTMRRTIVGHIRLGVTSAYATVILGVLAAGLASSAASAFAAAPETPVTKPASAITGASATLNGELNPKGKALEALEYAFLYKQSATECTGALVAPETPVNAVGKPEEAVSVPVTGLEPSKPYTFCVVATHAGESSMGTPVTFETLALKPVVESEASSAEPTQTAVTLEALINPNNQATSCKLEYGTSEALGTIVPCEPATLEGFREQHASANLAGLNPNTIYYYRVAVENATGQAEAVPIKELRTAPPPPRATTGEASAVTATSATIIGTVNPGSTGPNSETSYVFEYSRGKSETPSSLVECLISPSSCFLLPALPGGNAGQGTSDVHETETLAGLQPLTTYHYRIVAYNGSLSHALFGGGAVVGADAELTTLPEAPAVITGPPVSVTGNTVILAGEVVPQCVEGRYPPTTYRFEYGTTTSYGAGSEEATVAASSCATGGEAVTASLAGLAPDTVYHYRVDAKNSDGETQGKDGVFTTNAAGQPNSGPPPPGFSLTGPAPAAPTVVTFPNLTGFAPTPAASSGTKGSTSAAMTRAQRLSKGLKACKKDKSRARRAKCEKEARRKYGAKAKK